MYKNKIILSIVAVSCLISSGFADQIDPSILIAQTVLKSTDRSVNTGGDLSVLQSATDGVGSILVGSPTDTVDNSKMNSLVMKFGSVADKNGLSVQNQVLYGSNTTVIPTAIDSANASTLATISNVPANGTACNDGNSLTINDVYTNGVCAGTDNESCQNGYFGNKTTNINCDIGQNLTNLNGWIGLLSDTGSIDLNYNQLTNVDGLSNLHTVSYLGIDYNQLTNVDGLSNLTNVSALDLSFNQLTNVNGLSNLKNMDYLNLGENQLSTLNGLSNLQTISNQLYLEGNKFSNLNNLNNLTLVGFVLDIAFNSGLQDISGLNNVAMNTGSMFICDNKVYTTKLSATSPICDGIHAGNIQISSPVSNAPVYNICADQLTPMTYTITMSATRGVATTLSYVLSGTAISNLDYLSSTGTITIPAGSLSGTITIQVIGNTIPNPNKTVILTVTDITNGGSASGVGTIINDD